jgi:coenzyme F420-0:L-glutamate ligase / coenzyme F420-1:gamma-L-glutamate ligase
LRWILIGMAIKTFCKLARTRYRQPKRHAKASRLEAHTLRIPPKVRPFDLYDAITMTDFQFKDNDIIIVSSKFVSISEGSVTKMDRVKVTHKAKLIAKRFHLDEKLAELVLRESEHVYGGIPGFLLCEKNGMLCPNAGIDKSNIPKGYAVLYPRMPFRSAERLRLDFRNRKGLNVLVVISDSRLMPGRKGTTGIAISHSGFEPVIDERGKEDLFGNILKVTMRAVGDGLASTAVTIMGESNESTPVVVVRGFQVKKTDRCMTWEDLAIDPQEDIYVRAFRSK